MKKFFTLFAATLIAIAANAQLISFSEPVAKGSVGDTPYGTGNFTITVTDTDGKCEIDANNAYFGTAGEKVQFTHRLKTGGKSGPKNSITMNVPAEGTLKVYARTGSNSATDRNILVTQSGEEVIDHIMLESEAIEEKYTDEGGEEKVRKIYPVLTGKVIAGEVSIAYPVGSINFYGFELVTSGTPDAIKSINAETTAKKVVKDGKIEIVTNNGSFNAAGARVK